MRNKKIQKAISILLIQVFFAIEFIPFSVAINSGSKINLNKSVSREFSPDSKSVESIGSPVAESSVGDGIQIENSVKTNLAASAASSGPGQGESSGFSLGSADGMVNKFTGDFTYSIPLMDVEGYPLVLNYNSNVNMTSEASWVGLGWDLSVGGISREMKGIPDDFNGTEEIVRTYNQRKDEILDGQKAGPYIGVSYNFTPDNISFTPALQITALWGKYTNSYVGLGRTFDFGLQASFNVSGTKLNAAETNLIEAGLFGSGDFSFGYSKDTKRGIGTNSSFGLSGGYGPSDKKNDKLGGGISATYGTSFHSRSGMLEKSLSMGVSGRAGYDFSMNAGYTGTSTVSYGSATSIPRVMITSNSRTFQNNKDVFAGVKLYPWTVTLGMKFQDYNSEGDVILNSGNQVIQAAYGFLHSGKRAADNRHTKYPVMDFQRGSDHEYSVEMKNLPFSTQSYDIFYVNASGMNGTFRAGRTDFGTYYDPVTTSQMNGSTDDEQENDVVSKRAGVIITPTPPGLTISAGVGLGDQEGKTNTSVWDLGGTLNFNNTGNYTEKNFDPTVYFKGVGEMTPNDMSAWNAVGGNMADNFDVNKDGKEITLTDYLKESDINLTGVSLNLLNKKPVTATCFIPKIAQEISSVAQYAIYKYTTEGSLSNKTQISRITASHLANHISSIEVVSTDGLHYTYGLPAYNLSNQEVSFSSGNIDIVGTTAPALTYLPNRGVVEYLPGTDNSIGNTRGRSHMYDKTKMPAYAHSYLLTNMTSSDYVDRLNDGPSLDDIGSYYKFNYREVYGSTNPYNWRFPISGFPGDTPIAIQNRGLLGTELDDMAYYTYGEKEIWYTHSIESKNQVAFFYLKEREDAYGVMDENGILNTNMPLMYLDKIVLYNLSEYQSNPTTAIPIQTVEFEYDYSLCKNNPANSNTYNSNPSESGKLTLKKIRSYSGNSYEMGLAKYEFVYSTENPDYNLFAVDAWGNIKTNNTTKPNDIFPYPNQTNENLLDANSAAWKIVEIINPQGGSLEIEYEADRYGYVQEKKAMRHFDIYKMTSLVEFLLLQDKTSWNGTDYVSNNFRNDLMGIDELSYLFTSNGYSLSNFQNFIDGIINGLQFMSYITKFGKFKPKFIPNNVIIFQLDESLSGLTRQQAHQVVKDRYFKMADATYMEDLFIKAMINVKSGVTELVPTFAKISNDLFDPFENMLPFADDFKSIGVMPPNASGDYEYGYVIVDPVNTGSIEAPFEGENGEDANGLVMHPIQRAALDFVRQNLPDKIYGACVSCEGDLAVDKKAVFGKDIYKFMVGDAGYVPSIVPNQSVIRLVEPDGLKFGGNSRVKQIIYRDNWDAISAEYDSDYTWSYAYSDRAKETGVSSFEPLNMVDENPHYHWESFVNFKKRFPDESKFHPTPLTAALYPTPVVGYEEVKVTFSGGVSQGYSLTRFHTYKENPYKTISRKTAIEKSKSVSKLSPIKAYAGNSFALYGFTQGYEVETNDFHGKIDKTELYNRKNVLQARTKYVYYGLGEKIPMLNRKGELTNESVALEYDIHVDSRFIEDETKFRLMGLNVSVTFSGGFIPSGFGISPYFTKQDRKQAFYSNCLVKHINRSAVVKSIQTEYLGSINTAENEVYDKYSGNVIVSSLKDEFNDKLYSVNYPSHWYYDELCEYCPNSSLNATGTIFQGTYTLTGPSGSDLTDYYSAGDYVKFTENGGSGIYYGYLLVVNNGSAVVIDEDGTPLSYSGGASFTMSLVKSNRDNRLNETMQSIVTKKALSIVPGNFTFPKDEIISASVLTYRSRQNMRCGDPDPEERVTNEVAFNAVVNPFKYGVIGDLVPNNQFAWQDERINLTHPHGIRFDGTYATSDPAVGDFSPYYGLNATDKEWYALPESSHPNHAMGNDYQLWRELGHVQLFDEYGKALEGEDQIAISSSVLYGYNSALSLVPVAQAVNAHKQDIAFDGFEDYSYHASSILPVITESHFDFKGAIGGGITLTSAERHSGMNSLLVPTGMGAQTEKKVSDACHTIPNGITDSVFIANSCVCIPPFQPAPGEYLVGAWIKTGTGSAKIKIELLNNTTVINTFNFTPSGNLLDSWQRLEGTFDIPTSACTGIRVTMENTGNTNVFFDDFRMHPFLAGMTTVVYDPKTLLPVATHDGYNYTTFYNYDENLNMVRMRVETIEGIQTITEGEFGTQKSFKTN